MFSSGGVAPESIWDDIREVFGGVELTTGYGMTETAAATTTTLPEGDDVWLRTTNGRVRLRRALGGLIACYKAVDPETGAEVAHGQLGHLLVRGPVGQTPAAWVIPRDREQPPDPAELSEHCAGQLARFKVPREIFLCQPEDLPLTAVGRVQKYKLSGITQRRIAQHGT